MEIEVNFGFFGNSEAENLNIKHIEGYLRPNYFDDSNLYGVP